MLLKRPHWGFVHVPKTGGVSIKKTLATEVDTQTVTLHAPASAASGVRVKFGFVRNPWDRLVSLYSWMSQTELSWFDSQAIASAGFKAWLFDPAMPDIPAGRHWTNGGRAPLLNRRQQIWWLEGCDFVGRFEHMQEDFDRICDLIRIKRRSLGHENRSEHRPYQEFYDDASRKAVARWFAVDIQRWNYTF
jgi:hypothetical protein